MRQALALAALFGFGGFVYLWLGLPGFVGFGFGIGACVVALGLSSGYWIGDSEADKLVTELMRWRREKRSVAE
jgi:hypothetical protein